MPHGAWLFGVAAILLGVNAVRYLNHVGVNAFSTALGVVALIAALGQFWRTDLPLFAIFLIVLGVSLVVQRLFTRPT